ncbi:unnamed protein product, partial [Nesidiocoris tenuis]
LVFPIGLNVLFYHETTPRWRRKGIMVLFASFRTAILQLLQQFAVLRQEKRYPHTQEINQKMNQCHTSVSYVSDPQIRRGGFISEELQSTRPECGASDFGSRAVRARLNYRPSKEFMNETSFELKLRKS